MLQEGGRGGQNPKSCYKEPQKEVFCGQENVLIFLNGIFKAIIVDFYLNPGEKITVQARGVNKV